jgi:hypothetical protein
MQYMDTADSGEDSDSRKKMEQIKKKDKQKKKKKKAKEKKRLKDREMAQQDDYHIAEDGERDDGAKTLAETIREEHFCSFLRINSDMIDILLQPPADHLARPVGSPAVQEIATKLERAPDTELSPLSLMAVLVKPNVTHEMETPGQVAMKNYQPLTKAHYDAIMHKDQGASPDRKRLRFFVIGGNHWLIAAKRVLQSHRDIDISRYALVYVGLDHKMFMFKAVEHNAVSMNFYILRHTSVLIHIDV